MKNTSLQNSPTPNNNPSSELEQLIRMRAYELFEERGRENGHDLEDWIQAENEIVHIQSRRAAA